MENVKISTNGNKLIIEIDGAADLGPSKSGKSRLVASTQGNHKLTVAGREMFIGINAYTK